MTFPLSADGIGLGFDAFFVGRSSVSVEVGLAEFSSSPNRSGMGASFSPTSVRSHVQLPRSHAYIGLWPSHQLTSLFFATTPNPNSQFWGQGSKSVPAHLHIQTW